MSKFKVRITRVETYYRNVEVEAKSIEDAIAKAEENEQNNEYAKLFDCPDDVQTSFKDANSGEVDNEPVKVSPFFTMTITAKVDWDGDEGDKLPDAVQTLTLESRELLDAEVVDAWHLDEKTWNLDKGKLEEYVSDKLTDETGFCHNGFTFDYKINKGE